MPRTPIAFLPAAALLAGCVVAGCAPEAAPSTSAVPSPAPTTAEEPAETLLADEIAEDTAVGELAPGFPADLLPVPPGAEVLVSSAEPAADGRLRISLNVRTPQDTAGLLEAVRGPLLAAGFAEAAPPAPEAGLAAQTSFARSDGTELLVVAVLDRAEVRTMTLGGTVAVGAP